MNFDVGNTPESLNFIKREEPFVSTHSFGSGQDNLGSLDQNSPMMPNLGGLSDDAIALESAKARLQQNLVTLRNAPDFLLTMQTAFGDQWDPAQAKAVVDDVIRGEADITFEISDAEDLLSKGAYGENTVFISDDLLTGGSGTSAVLDDVLLEEVGHYFDQELNSEDSPGDEGAIFSRLAQGQTFSDLELLRFGKENDHFLLQVNDRLIAVEQSDDFSAHTVQAGETLWGIATSQLGDGTRWTEILKDSEDPSSTFSETEAGQIQPGETIYLPSSESSLTPLDTDQSQGSSEDVSETNIEEPAIADPIVADTAAPASESPSSDTITDSGVYPGYIFEYEEGQAFVEDAKVEEWQQRMVDLGWTIGVDGKYGPESARVAEEFQTLYDDLTNDGIVGEQTWAKTFSSDALGPSPEIESEPTGNSSTGFANKVEEIAQQEWQYFDQGTLKEGEDRAWQRVVEYWQFIGRSDIDTSQEVSSSSNPWSSAFISWVMNEAGAGDQFNYSALHADYVYKAVIAKNSNDTSEGLWGHRLDEYSPKVGDLINLPRTSDSYNSYDEILNGKSSFPSHSDIVVGIDLEKGELTAIGGNVSDTVAIKTFSIDNQGRITGINPDEGVILENRIEGGATQLDSIIPHPESDNPPIANTPPASSTSSSNTTSIIQSGSTGDDVEAIQDALNILGFDSGTSDGDFGPNTDAAVRRFQEGNSLTVDGKVGQNTLEELENELQEKKDDLQDLKAQNSSFAHEFEDELGVVNSAINRIADVSLTSSSSNDNTDTASINTEVEQRTERIEELKEQIEVLGTDQPNAVQAIQDELEGLLREEKEYLDNRAESLQKQLDEPENSNSVSSLELQDELDAVQQKLENLEQDLVKPNSNADKLSSNTEVEQRTERIDELKKQIEVLGTHEPNVTQALEEELELLLVEEKEYLESQINSLGTSSSSVTKASQNIVQVIEGEINQLNGGSATNSILDKLVYAGQASFILQELVGDAVDEIWEDIKSETDAALDEAWEGAKQFGGFFKGFGEGIWDEGSAILALAEDLYDITGPSNPLYNTDEIDRRRLETYNEYKNALSSIKDDPEAFLYGFVEPIVNDWENGNYGEAVGRSIFEVASIVVPTKISKLTRAKRLAKETIEQAGEEFAEKTVNEITEKAAIYVAEEIDIEFEQIRSEQFFQEAREEMGEQSFDELMDNVLEELKESIIKELRDGSAAEMAEEFGLEAAEKHVNEVAKDIEAQMLKEGLTEDFAKEISQEVAQEAILELAQFADSE